MTPDWQPWTGGECPVARGTEVDVEHRDGEIYLGHRAGIHSSKSYAAAVWRHFDMPGDIVKFRYPSRKEMEQ
ncbi:hypothetical protein PX554_17985 [Sphingomonas sp. H39-1-10]|uniref:hypothetical protein n=1 Tax=Sphingomonas pollutisoli TaxID=3030829 RepID=UPI0023BA0123|nr:hypothetical protein [Sphingomonas pollutisoli]MDF0490029.1 hypothetical protein [Sphingomonas pollutisoli]